MKDNKMLYFGVDYYPEHWSEARWSHDADLMRAAGFNVVRLAEFAWSVLEPQPGVYDFAWLDAAIDTLTARGMQIVLGTPSAAVPPWLFSADMGLVRADGVRLTYGSRRDMCPLHPDFRAAALHVTQAMADHYRAHPAVIGWQIDNELGDRCYCDRCRTAFQGWLCARYGTLDALNTAWGTRFWSHVYTDWGQIPAARTTTHAHHNPGLHLDYQRFMSQVYVGLQQAQIDALRARIPAHQRITHNLMGFGYNKINYFDLAAPLDFVSWDNYPRGFWINQTTLDPVTMAVSHAAMHGLKGQNFWVMEQQSGHAGWTEIPPTPRPGEIALWAYQAIAHGADGIVFFRWRTARHGAEQYWHGLLDHDGQPRRRYAEVKALGAQLGQVGTALAGTTVYAEAAILHDYDTRFAFQLQPGNAAFSYPGHVTDYYRALHSQGIPAHVVGLTADLSAYKLVIAPALHIVTEAQAAVLRAYVEAGGVLVLTARSGVRDTHNAIVDLPLPGLLATLVGAQVEEYDSLLPDDPRSVTFHDGQTGQATLWCDALRPTGAETLATYTGSHLDSIAAVTLHRVGRGAVIYAGAVGDEALTGAVVAKALKLAHPRRLLATPPGVEVTLRCQGDAMRLFLLNHTASPQVVPLDALYTDLLTGQPHSQQVTLPPYGVMILARPVEAS